MTPPWRQKAAEDRQLAQDLLDGDAEALRVIRRWIQRSFRPFQSRLRGELEDIEQDTLLRLTEDLRTGRFRSDCRLATYVRVCAQHACIDRTRRLRVRQWVGLEETVLVSPAPSAFETLRSRQSVEMALRVTAQMPESCRELWRLLHLGYGYREMAEHLGVAEGTLRLRVLRCRRRAVVLRQRLAEEEGVTKGEVERLGERRVEMSDGDDDT